MEWQLVKLNERMVSGSLWN